MRTVRISKSVLASFGSGKKKPKTDDDDDIEFFDTEEPPAPKVTEYGKFKTPVCEDENHQWKCMWCFVIATRDDRGRFGRMPCPNCKRFGVTLLSMKDKKQVYIEED